MRFKASELRMAGWKDEGSRVHLRTEPHTGVEETMRHYTSEGVHGVQDSFSQKHPDTAGCMAEWGIKQREQGPGLTAGSKNKSQGPQLNICMISV